TDVRQAEAGGSLIFRFGCGSRHPGPVWKRHPVPGPWTWCRRTCGNTGRGTVEPRRDEMVLNADTPVPVSCGPGYWLTRRATECGPSRRGLEHHPEALRTATAPLREDLAAGVGGGKQ